MIVLKIFKWLVFGAIGLFALAYAGLWLYFGVINPAEPPDHFHGIEKDLGICPEFREGGMLYTETTMLGESKYHASFGAYKMNPRSEPPWEGIFIGVSKTGTEILNKKTINVSYPFFSRWFTKDVVPDSLWNKEVEDLAKYDSESRTVTFALGFTNITTKLPSPDEENE